MECNLTMEEIEMVKYLVEIALVVNTVNVDEAKRIAKQILDLPIC